MRMLLDIVFPHEPFNAAVRKGTAGQTISKILEALKPEAVYFTEQDGRRGAILVVNANFPQVVEVLGAAAEELAQNNVVHVNQIDLELAERRLRMHALLPAHWQVVPLEVGQFQSLLRGLHSVGIPPRLGISGGKRVENPGILGARKLFGSFGK